MAAAPVAREVAAGEVHGKSPLKKFSMEVGIDGNCARVFSFCCLPRKRLKAGPAQHGRHGDGGGDGGDTQEPMSCAAGNTQPHTASAPRNRTPSITFLALYLSSRSRDGEQDFPRQVGDGEIRKYAALPGSAITTASTGARSAVALKRRANHHRQGRRRRCRCRSILDQPSGQRQLQQDLQSPQSIDR